MEMLCPECMGPLEIVEGKRVRCTIHGGQYEVLFSRWLLSPPSPTPKAEDWGTSLAAPSTRAVPRPDFGGEPARLQGKECTNHPGVPAVRLCKSCGAAICETCAFKCPGNVYVCPACAASPQSGLGPKQTKYLAGSFVCAVAAMLVMAFTFFLLPEPQSEEEVAVIGTVTVFAVIGLTIAGTALSAAARIPRQPAPVPVWIALIWNVLLLAGILLMCLVGVLMGA